MKDKRVRNIAKKYASVFNKEPDTPDPMTRRVEEVVEEFEKRLSPKKTANAAIKRVNFTEAGYEQLLSELRTTLTQLIKEVREEERAYVVKTIDLYNQKPSKGLDWLRHFLTRKAGPEAVHPITPTDLPDNNEEECVCGETYTNWDEHKPHCKGLHSLTPTDLPDNK